MGCLLTAVFAGLTLWAQLCAADSTNSAAAFNDLWPNATGARVLWEGVEMTLPEPTMLPVTLKEKIRDRMSPRQILDSFGKGWMSKLNGVGSIAWRFQDGSMIFIFMGHSPIDQPVDVHRYESKGGDSTGPTKRILSP